MVFRVASPIINESRYNFWILHGARLAIATYNIKPAQKQLNEYLWKKFGLNIKAACMLVVANCRIQKNQSNEVIITFPSKRINNIAALITYGDGKIQGCSILKEAFGRH
jgi:hypothetical protein